MKKDEREDLEEIGDDTDEILEDTNEILKKMSNTQKDIIKAIKSSKENKWWIIGLFLIDKLVMATLILLLGRN